MTDEAGHDGDRRAVLAEAQAYYYIIYYIILHYTILYYTILYYTILYYTILFYTIIFYTILYYTILYYTILYYTILYYALDVAVGRDALGLGGGLDLGNIPRYIDKSIHRYIDT